MSDLDFILKYFPDAVDVQMAPTKTVLEFSFDTDVFERVIDLVELEPETGIYAGMSSYSHRVYVYCSDEVP